jgi:hypothetical protein
MPFEWLTKFHHSEQKPEDYAERTLAAYRLGMRAGGSIKGVEVQPDADSCAAAKTLPVGQVYHPDDAPRLPLPGCPLARRCTCVYRPVMSYQEKN